MAATMTFAEAVATWRQVARRQATARRIIERARADLSAAQQTIKDREAELTASIDEERIALEAMRELASESR